MQMHRRNLSILMFLVMGLQLFLLPKALAAYSRAERVAFQRSIIDRRGAINRKFKKIRRKKTKYIIVHTSEAGLRSTLNVVSKGKRMRSGYRTYGGHAHYVIARNGRTYRILDKRYQADHAGRSMWNGETDISQVSIGIELVGYHYTSITKKQYRSVGILIDLLKRVYHLNDQAVLTHSQIAYGKPNRWIRKNHRGRKKCAKNFDRRKAGLGPTWRFDPDVKAGRLVADKTLAEVYYKRRRYAAKQMDSNMISSRNTAWSIAGEDYDSPTTLYRFPDGKLVPGDEIEHRIGWDHIPKRTIVLLNQEEHPDDQRNQGPVKTIANGLTAWSFAGQAYRDKHTFYFFPNGRIKNGQQISDWDDLPSNTKMIIGYGRPNQVTRKIPPARIAGDRYNHKETIYFIPGKSVTTGDRIKNFKRIPARALIFLPMRKS